MLTIDPLERFIIAENILDQAILFPSLPFSLTSFFSIPALSYHDFQISFCLGFGIFGGYVERNNWNLSEP